MHLHVNEKHKRLRAFLPNPAWMHPAHGTLRGASESGQGPTRESSGHKNAQAQNNAWDPKGIRLQKNLVEGDGIGFLLQVAAAAIRRPLVLA